MTQPTPSWALTLQQLMLLTLTRLNEMEANMAQVTDDAIARLTGEITNAGQRVQTDVAELQRQIEGIRSEIGAERAAELKAVADRIDAQGARLAGMDPLPAFPAPAPSEPQTPTPPPAPPTPAP